MVYIYRKTINKKPYYYARASKRKNGKIVVKDIAYLGNTLEEVRKNLEKLPKQQLRDAYKTISKFLESNIFLEQAQEEKLKHSPFIGKSLLEEVEACRLHWQKKFLKRDAATRMQYLKQFAIEFTFNTTSLEGNTITLKEAQRLLEEDILPKDKLLREVHDIQNTERVFLGLFDKPVSLSHDTVIGLHKGLLANIDKRVGYRTENIHVFRSRFDATPAPYVKTDMELLAKWSSAQDELLHPLAHAGIMHHKFEKIHPFYDGNGRTGRMLMTGFLLKRGYPPLIIRKKNRVAYLDVLSKADDSLLTLAKPQQYNPLVEFLAGELVDTYWSNFL